MTRSAIESKLRTLVDHAWEQEVRWPHIEAWAKNFSGDILGADDEQLHALFALSRFLYFGKRMLREMLKSLYRDHFESPMIQRIRRNYGETKDVALVRSIYKQELGATRFLGVGNPSESGAHLLYFFRQINYLSKDLFVDLGSAFRATAVRNATSASISYVPQDAKASRYVFFDDLVGSGTQASGYLSTQIKGIRRDNPQIELKFMSLFATPAGLAKMNAPNMFDGNAMCLFELDDTYKVFSADSRYFAGAPSWFDSRILENIAFGYGKKIKPGSELGYKDGQLLLGFTHNTPDNTLPIFWDEGSLSPWAPVLIRYDKAYG